LSLKDLASPFPDLCIVSFTVYYLIVIINHCFLAGTSCAAPVFSGVISLVNDALLSAGKKPVGFLNPVPSPLSLSHTLKDQFFSPFLFALVFLFIYL